MHYTFHPNTKVSSLISLSKEESHHLVRVLRAKLYDEVHILDGAGSLFKGTIQNMDRNSCLVQVDDLIRHQQKQPKTHLLVAPTKNISRFEWMVEKSIELGVQTITPILTKRTERKVVKKERLEKIALAALKQSGNLYMPAINDLTTYVKSFEFIGQEAKKLIANCNEDCNVLMKEEVEASEIAVLIGPEGDFTDEELEIAQKNGFKSISLGQNRLRVETAAIAVCTLIAAKSFI